MAGQGVNDARLLTFVIPGRLEEPNYGAQLRT